MASSSNGIGPSHPVVFTTQTAYPLPSQKYMIPVTWKRYQLSQLINKALSLPNPVPFDFLVRGEVLRGSLAEWRAENGVGEEETLEIEYIESVMPPQRMSELPHEDWVSSVSCEVPRHFITASYDGNIRVFNYSQTLVSQAMAHSAPTTSLCLVPSSTHTDTDTDPITVASASHDLTAHLTQISLSPDNPQTPKALASLHLHTAPLSSISSNASGSHLLTSSWDSLIGLWDTVIPIADEVPLEPIASGDRQKRRKLANDDTAEKPKRKAPLTVLRSHTARVSKVIFGGDKGKAYSCGFDSTVRMWDVENGICTHTITAAEKPMLDLAQTPDMHTLLSASTDRTISLFDLRLSSSSSTPTAISATLTHPATPSCIATSPSSSSPHQVVSGAYDGVVRLWDLRSAKSAMTSFKAWDAEKKVLSVDWKGGVVGVGGEGGLGVWKVGIQDERLAS